MAPATARHSATVNPYAFVEPTILAGVSPTMRAYREELFGPVAMVHSVAGEDEAVAPDAPVGGFAG
jgi:acyl-CoA reductase-like NAD-dependent aldehyde dehydrogenase